MKHLILLFALIASILPKQPETIIVTETEYVTEHITETRYICVVQLQDEAETLEYTPDASDVTALAKTLWGECRGCSKLEQSGVAWCVLNRLDAGYADTVLGVVSAPGQFTGYSANHPVTDELADLAADVLTRHWLEGQGEENVGRTLPSDYLWFSGSGGHNWFRNEFRSNDYWGWDLDNPYEEEKE